MLEVHPHSRTVADLRMSAAFLFEDDETELALAGLHPFEEQVSFRRAFTQATKEEFRKDEEPPVRVASVMALK